MDTPQEVGAGGLGAAPPAQGERWVVWEALNILGQIFIGPESILTKAECTYNYACGGLPPNCIYVRKAKVLGPYCTREEAWAHLCSRISNRGRFAISSNCPYWIVLDGVRHNTSWDPWQACPKIGPDVVIPPPPPPEKCPPLPPTPTPTATATASPTPTQIPDLTVRRIEVFQATQDELNSISLVQDKLTVARVFVGIGFVPYTTVVGVTGEMVGYRGGDELPGSPIRPLNGAIDATDVISRVAQAGALDFFLPAEWLHGTVTLVANVDAPDTIPETDEQNNKDSVAVTFHERCPVQLGYVPILYDIGQPGGPQAPPPAAIAAPQRVFLKTYPVGSASQVAYFQLLPALRWTEPLADFAAVDNLRLRLRQLLVLAQWPAPLRSPLSQIVGWMPEVPVYQGITGISDPRWDTNPGGTDQVFWAQAWANREWTLAHEIAHNFGLRHTNLADGLSRDSRSLWPVYFSNSRTQEVGYDAFDWLVKDPTRFWDLMTYQPGPTRWISPFHYSGDPVNEVGLYQRLAPPCVESTDVPPRTPTPTATPAPTCRWWYPLDLVAPPWQWVREDRSHWSTAELPGYLRILTQPGDLAGTLNSARNLLLQPLLADGFEASTLLLFAPTMNGQAAGLLLYQDDDNYLFLARAYQDGSKVVFVREQGGVRDVRAVDFAGRTTYLRLVRSGGSFTGYFGATPEIGQRVFEWQSGLQNLRMGLAAWNGGAVPSLPASFDYYCVNPVAAPAPPRMAPALHTPAAGAAAAAPAAGSDCLMISGTLFRAGGGRLNPVTRVNLTRVPEPPAAGTTFCVALRRADGTELSAYCFDDAFVDYETGEPVDSRALLLFVPDRPGVDAVVLRRGAAVVAQQTRSAHAPQVTLVEPAGGEQWVEQGRVRWSATDADGDPLRYTVLFSADDKSSWRALDVDLATTELTVDTGALPGTERGYLRVLATDGLNTAQADCAAPIRVTTKPPRVTILEPLDGTTWPPGAALVLHGSAHDFEDGFLPDQALTWYSDRAGRLGQGTTLDVPALPLGRHVIRLTARDSDGQEGGAAIVLHVGRQVYLPFTLKPTSGGVTTPTPGPTAWPATACEPLFREDFRAPGLPGWTAKGGTWTNPGGYMEGASGPVADAWNVKAVPAVNFVYEGTVTVRQGNVAGLTFRSTDGTQGYELNLDVNGGQLVLARRAPYKALGTWAADIQRDRPYRLRVEARWGHLDAYLDGVRRISVLDTTYGIGNVGVSAWNSVADYDDLSACAMTLPFGLRLDAGSAAHTTDQAGRLWLADQVYVAGNWGFVGGRQASTQDPIAGTEDDLLYRTVRWDPGTWSMKADVPNGDYTVRLGFTETYYTAAGRRVFDVRIEDQPVLTDLDLFAVAGHDVAYSRSFDVTVGGGQLNIDFVSKRDGALVAVIEVLVRGAAEPTPVVTATRTPSAGPTSTGTPAPRSTLTPTRWPTGSPSATATRSVPGTATPTQTVTPGGGAVGLYGRVTKRGLTAVGVALSLRRYDDATDVEVARTTTGTDGRYVFAGLPALPADTAYYVYFGPNETDPSAVHAWYGPDVTHYTAGSDVPAGDFDIANVALLAPAADAAVSLPAVFSWQRRGLAGDTYQVYLLDADSGEEWRTPDLGDVGSFTMSGLGAGMVYNQVYHWYVRVLRGPGSYGESYYMRRVTFRVGAAGIHPPVSD